MQQTCFNFQFAHSKTLKDFFCAQVNVPLVHRLKGILSDTVLGDNRLLLYGATGVGKTHLLLAIQAYCLPATAWYINLYDSEILLRYDRLLQDDVSVDLVLIDNLEAMMTQSKMQHALFAWFNELSLRGCALLFASRYSPQQLTEQDIVADLSSRLQLMESYALMPITDDIELKQFIVFWLAKRGMTIKPNAIDYLLTHYSRAQVDVVAYLALLDKMALTHKKSITVPLIKQALSSNCYE